MPRRLIWDNEAGIGRRGRLAAGVAEFCGTLATRVHQLKPHDPESKGVVERRNGFFETSFMPGRSFDSPADFNAQFTDWLERANRRVVRTLKARPIDLVDADRAAMLALPPIPPHGRLVEPDPAWAATTTCASTPTTTPSTRPRSAGRSPSPPTWNGSGCASTAAVVADHARVWARQHDRHRSRPRRRPPSCCASSSAARDAVDDDALARDLADYDRAFGLDVDGQVA